MAAPPTSKVTAKAPISGIIERLDGCPEIAERLETVRCRDAVCTARLALPDGVRVVAVTARFSESERRGSPGGVTPDRGLLPVSDP